jgi:hypothetical protein
MEKHKEKDKTWVEFSTLDMGLHFHHPLLSEEQNSSTNVYFYPKNVV